MERTGRENESDGMRSGDISTSRKVPGRSGVRQVTASGFGPEASIDKSEAADAWKEHKARSWKACAQVLTLFIIGSVALDKNVNFKRAL